MEMNFKIIAVDFDGTLCTNRWPDIGEPNASLIKCLKQEALSGTKLILWTCRTGDLLDEACAWCTNQGLYFDAVNDNIPEAASLFGGDSRKVFAHLYLDDKALTINADTCINRCGMEGNE